MNFFQQYLYKFDKNQFRIRKSSNRSINHIFANQLKQTSLHYDCRSNLADLRFQWTFANVVRTTCPLWMHGRFDPIVRWAKRNNAYMHTGMYTGWSDGLFMLTINSAYVRAYGRNGTYEDDNMTMKNFRELQILKFTEL